MFPEAQGGNSTNLTLKVFLHAAPENMLEGINSGASLLRGESFENIARCSAKLTVVINKNNKNQ